MRTIKLLGIMLISVLMSINITSCSRDDNDEGDSGINATIEAIVGDWYITSVEVIKGDHANWQGGKNLSFSNSGTCHTCNKMENRYKIKNGKIETYYSETFEPMYVYTILSWEKNSMVLKRDGTLDDTSSCKLMAVREAQPVQNPNYGNN